MTFKEFLNEAGFSKYPAGWDKDSIKKWVKTFKEKHGEEDFFDKCVLHMKDKLGGEENAKRFCASIKDEFYQSVWWRGKGKTEKEIEADVKSHKKIPYKPKGETQKQIAEK